MNELNSQGAPATRTIEIWFDFASNYSWGDDRLDDALDRCAELSR